MNTLPPDEKYFTVFCCCRKDEHSLISVYCQKLLEGSVSNIIPDSPMQVALEIDAEQRKELEFMIK